MKFVDNAISLSEKKHRSKSSSSSCVKMTDQAPQHVNGNVNSIKVSVNGIYSPKKHSGTGGHPHHNNSEDSDPGATSPGGGRLKFFKDGKFILELSHRKEGEKTCWIPVPKKTYWPAVGTPRQETSTSLSVSDDNSSVQSSPWQRDHCWKQSSPRKNICTELQFYLHFPHKSRYYSFCSKSVRRKCRRPIDPTPVRLRVNNPVQNKLHKTEHRPGVTLAQVTHVLWERALKQHNESPTRPPHEMVTLRKRILKELEKVNLGDSECGGSKRRAKTSHVTPAPATTPAKHSITAILGHREYKTEDSPSERENSPSFLRTLLKSPHSDSASDSRPSSSSSRPPSAPHPPPLVYHPTPTPYYPWTVQYIPRTPVPLYPSSSWMPLASHATPWMAGHPPLSHPPLHAYIKQEDSGDVPLNLSKNGG
uniref:Protein hairless n=1 Tax=Cacopsylla melanoneura TaxID=428564 RepID=A0A8D8VKE7_9HEMI